MMINKMLSHWKIGCCARAHPNYIIAVLPWSWDSRPGTVLRDDGRLPARRARPIQTVWCNYQGPRTLVHNDTQHLFLQMKRFNKFCEESCLWFQFILGSLSISSFINSDCCWGSSLRLIENRKWAQLRLCFLFPCVVKKQIQNMIHCFPPILQGQMSDKLWMVSEKWNFYYNENILLGQRILGLSVYPTKRVVEYFWWYLSF